MESNNIGLKRNTEYEEEGSLSSTSTSLRADSSEQKRISDIPNGVRFFALINRRGRIFIPSTKNIFGSIKVSRVLCDSACSTFLIPIETPQVLDNIFLD